MLSFSKCEECIHLRKNIDGWRMACDAFPNGFPKGFLKRVDVTKIPECNNGIGFEPIDKKATKK